MKSLTSSLTYFIVHKLSISNKAAIQYILAGRVLVNGRQGKLTQELLPEDEVQVDGQVIKEPTIKVYMAFHKPRGIESTMNARIEGNLLQALDIAQSVFPVGRLDKESEGLMLLTNDGGLLYKILHAEKSQEKEYEVTVDKPLTQLVLERLAAGVVIMGKKDSARHSEAGGGVYLQHDPDTGAQPADQENVLQAGVSGAETRAHPDHLARTGEPAPRAMAPPKPARNHSSYAACF